MKIQIDTENKIIKVEGKVNLNEFFKVLKNLFPKNEWKEFEFETNTVIQNWAAPYGSPIIVRSPYFPYPPYYSPIAYADNDTGTIYNIETL